MDVFAPIAAAFENKDREIKETEAKIKEITSSLANNVELVKQRDQEIARLNASLKQLGVKIETAKENEVIQQSKVNKLNQKCTNYEKQIAEKLDEEEKTLKILNEAKAEYELIKEQFNDAKQRYQEEESRKLQEFEEQKTNLLNSISDENERIAELQNIAQKMRNQFAQDLEKMTSDHVQAKQAMDLQISELEKSNAELSEALRSAQQRARTEINEREQQLQKFMNEKEQMDKEKAAESNATIQKLQIEIDQKKSKLVQLQNEVQTLIQSQKSREEGIEQIRIQYQESEQQIQEQTQAYRDKRKKQKLEIERLKQAFSEAKKLEEDQKRKIKLIQKEQYENQEEYQKYKQAISEHQAILENAYNDITNKTEFSVSKLREAENILKELQNKEVDLKNRAKSAGEELQRQHNEALRSRKVINDKKATLAQLKGSIARIRAERKEKFANPKLSTIEIPPQINPKDNISGVPFTPNDDSTFGIPLQNNDIFNLSPISSIGQQGFNQQSVDEQSETSSQPVAQLISQIESLNQTCETLYSRLLEKREQVNALMAEGSELDELRKENEILRQKKDEMEEMKKEIDRIRHNRPQI